MKYCLVVEDHKPHLELLISFINNDDNLEFVDSCSNSNSIIPLLEESKKNGKPIDLLFLDIGLDDGEDAGMIFLKTYKGFSILPNVIITTTEPQKEHNLEILKINQIKYYLKKPIFSDFFSEAVKKVLNLPESPNFIHNVSFG